MTNCSLLLLCSISSLFISPNQLKSYCMSSAEDPPQGFLAVVGVCEECNTCPRVTSTKQSFFQIRTSLCGSTTPERINGLTSVSALRIAAWAPGMKEIGEDCVRVSVRQLSQGALCFLSDCWAKTIRAYFHADLLPTVFLIRLLQSCCAKQQPGCGRTIQGLQQFTSWHVCTALCLR